MQLFLYNKVMFILHHHHHYYYFSTNFTVELLPESERNLWVVLSVQYKLYIITAINSFSL